MENPAWRGPDPTDITAWTIVQAGHQVGRTFWSALGALQLTPIQFGVLIELDRTPGASNAHLARTVLVTPQAMSELLTGLAADGLIERDHSAGPGRRVPTTLTGRGRERLRACEAVIEDVERSLGIGADDRRHLRLLLRRVLTTDPVGD